MDAIVDTVRTHWGYSELRPLQREAMEAALARRDALVVLPTGGGKSLCYQAPALMREGVTVVVSPLISLMKDQVDGLLERGIAAAFINSSLDPSDRRRVAADLSRGRTKLLFVAPERFSDGFHALLERVGVAAFAIDEAHCISHWGHDFREDYRRLGELKRRYPGVPVHAFTATATPRVRGDVVAELGLADPAVLVGDFFRPNLRYRAEPRRDDVEDALREIRARGGEAGIVYCIRRADVDRVCSRLRTEGVKCAPYHAGMTDEERTRVQDRFAAAEVDVVVATVAFGMGIDRADVRFVIHAAMPKSLEHYQQETGRAGRDGKPADCVLFSTGGDWGLWKSIIEKGGSADLEHQMRMLSEMYAYVRGTRCRHRSLVEYFGQAWRGGPCGACDVCRGEREEEKDSERIARRLLASVQRTGQRFGAPYIVEVVRGESTERVMARGHVRSEAFGVLEEFPRESLLLWMDELVDQGFLRREGEYGVLKLTPLAWKHASGEARAVLHAVAAPAKRKRKPKKKAKEAAAVDGPVDASLFEELRTLRREIAEEQDVPAYVVMSDRTLRELARVRPSTERELLEIHGIGEARAERYGARFLRVLKRG